MNKAKMYGKIHRRQCDCNCKYVSGIDEKCNRVFSNKRNRSREKRAWKKEAMQYAA